MISAPRMMAVVPEPGTPSASIGTMAPAAAALLDASGPGDALDGALAELVRDASTTFFSTM